MKGLVVAALVTLSTALAGRPAYACAGCRNPSMPITRLEALYLAPGELRVAAILGPHRSVSFTPAGCADVTNCAELPAQPIYLHDQRILPGELRPVLELGIAGSMGAELHVPFRLTRTSIKYQQPDGLPYMPLDPSLHHRDETLAGMGDPLLLARWNPLASGVLLTFRAGVSLPLGRTEQNPFALGTLDYAISTFNSAPARSTRSLDSTFPAFGRLQVASYAQAQATIYDNRHGFRGGTRVLTGAQFGRRFGSATAAIGGDVMYEGAERWAGRIQQDGNLGRTEVLAGVSVVQTVGRTAFGFTARFPLWRHIVRGEETPGTLSSPVMLSAVVSHTFKTR